MIESPREERWLQYRSDTQLNRKQALYRVQFYIRPIYWVSTGSAESSVNIPGQYLHGLNWVSLTFSNISHNCLTSTDVSIWRRVIVLMQVISILWLTNYLGLIYTDRAQLVDFKCKELVLTKNIRGERGVGVNKDLIKS